MKLLLSPMAWVAPILLFRASKIQAQAVLDASVPAVWKNYDEGRSICGTSRIRAVLLTDQILFVAAQISNDSQSFDAYSPPPPFLFSIPINAITTMNTVLDSTNLRYSQMPDGVQFPSGENLLWASDTALFTFNIENNSENNTAVISYNAKDDFWTDSMPSGHTFGISPSSPHQILNVPQIGASLFFNDHDYVIVNHSESSGQRWTAQTLIFSSELGDGLTYSSNLYASYFFVPVGEMGVILSMGGLDPFNRQDVPFDQISILDVHSNKRYSVIASGAVPRVRQEFCGWVTVARDKSSYSVTIYGGKHGEGANEEIYVLSLPSFTWVLVRNDTRGAGSGIFGHSCHSKSSGAGFVLGGDPSMQEDGVVRSCNIMPFRMLNLSTFAWEQTYEPSSDDSFQVHKSIYKVIGGGESGGATKTKPAAGWHTSLEAIFSSATSYPAVAGQNGEPFEESPDGPSKMPGAGTIVGAAVGGFAGLFVLILILRWNHRRRRREIQQFHDVELENTEYRDISLQELEHPPTEVLSERHLITTELPSEPRAYEMWAGGRWEHLSQSAVLNH